MQRPTEGGGSPGPPGPRRLHRRAAGRDHVIAFPMVAAFILMNVERPRLKTIADDLLAIDGGLSGILNTETLIAFKTFAKKDLGMLWDIGVD
jgi:hypothetical protein